MIKYYVYVTGSNIVFMLRGDWCDQVLCFSYRETDVIKYCVYVASITVFMLHQVLCLCYRGTGVIKYCVCYIKYCVYVTGGRGDKVLCLCYIRYCVYVTKGLM